MSENEARSHHDDPNERALFTEACQMFRHLVMMRYYVIAAFAVGSAALIALSFNRDSTLTETQRWVTKKTAGVISLLCIPFELRIAYLITHFQAGINLLARPWKPQLAEKANDRITTDWIAKPFVPPGTLFLGQWFWYIDVTSLSAIAIYLLAAFCWIMVA